MTVRETVTSRTTGLTSKFLFPFAIPPGTFMTNLHGSFTIKGSVPLRHAEALFSVRDAGTGRCPERRQDIGTYPALFETFPSSGLANIIVKQVGDAPRTQRLDVDLPAGAPLAGPCGLVVLDGTDFLGQAFTMAVDLHVSYAPSSSPIATSLRAIGDEFILGANNSSNAFSLTHIERDTTLLAVFGNVSAVTMLHSGYAIPNSDWTAVHRLLVYHGGCAMFPNPFQDTEAPWLDSSTDNRPVVYAATLSGVGNQAVDAPFTAVMPTPIALRAGDCLVHAVNARSARTTNRAAFNTELQAILEVSP